MLGMTADMADSRSHCSMPSCKDCWTGSDPRLGWVTVHIPSFAVACEACRTQGRSHQRPPRPGSVSTIRAPWCNRKVASDMRNRRGVRRHGGIRAQAPQPSMHSRGPAPGVPHRPPQGRNASPLLACRELDMAALDRRSWGHGRQDTSRSGGSPNVIPGEVHSEVARVGAKGALRRPGALHRPVPTARRTDPGRGRSHGRPLLLRAG